MIYLLFRPIARSMLHGAHTAEADVENCLLLLGEIVERTAPTSWEQLWKYSEAARVPDVMPFGKHKGMAIEDVPADYKAWLLRQPDVDPYLVKALRGQR